MFTAAVPCSENKSLKQLFAVLFTVHKYDAKERRKKYFTDEDSCLCYDANVVKTNRKQNTN